MKDERSSPAAGITKCVLLVLSWIYTAAVKCVDLSYRTGLRPGRKAAVPVVSVGNITLGGTGKTPFVIYIADLFQTRGRKTAVLTRGYGGDESRMIMDELPDVPVIVGQDRVRSAGNAVSEQAEVLILDDGFQHRRIARDLDVLLLDSFSLFGNGYLFPRGALREPVSALQRADIIVLTKSDRPGVPEKQSMIEKIRSFSPSVPVVMARHRVTSLSDVTGTSYPGDRLSGKKVCLASGIGDPEYFLFLVESLGGIVVSRHDYDDHHRYSQHDVERIRSGCAASGAELIIITRKDFVKIKHLDISGIEDKLFVLNVVMDVFDGKEQLIAGLDSIFTGTGS